MQKLASALDPASHYDEEYASLKNRHDEVRARCSALWRSARLSLQDETGGGAGRQRPSAPNEPIGGTEELHQGLVQLVARVSRADSSVQPVPLLAERIRAEVNEAAELSHDLEATRHRLCAFFQRRRERLRATTRMISRRLKRHVVDWEVSQYAGPHLHERLRLLQLEIESAEARCRRLDMPGQLAKKEPREIPLAKASTGEPLFRQSGPYAEGTLCPIFQSDVAVCLRELVYEDRATRTLRRFMHRMQHAPLSHRAALCSRAKRLQSAATGQLGAAPGALSPLPLKRVVMSERLEAFVVELAKEVGCPGLLQTDGGEALARAVLTDFPALFKQQCRSMEFPPYASGAEQQSASGSPSTGAGRGPASGVRRSARAPLLKRDPWLPFVLVQPAVDMASVEQRALMRGSGVVEQEPGAPGGSAPSRPSRARGRKEAARTSDDEPKGLDAELVEELAFLRADGDAEAERRLSELAAQRGKPADRGGASADGQEDLVPDHILRTFYVLRYLHARDLRRKLLALLNAFRLVQQRIAHGALSRQLGSSDEATGVGVGDRVASEESAFELELPDSAEVGSSSPHCLGAQPPTLASGAPGAHPGDLGATAREALAAMSELERAVPTEGGGIAVEDGHGVHIMHEAALADLEAFENEMVAIGSHAVRVAPPALRRDVDRAGILTDLYAAELVYHQAKWRLVEPYLEAYEQAAEPAHQHDIAQRMADVMAERPRFNLQTGRFAEAYVLATAAVESRARLLREVMWYQVQLEASVARGIPRREEILRMCSGPKSKDATAGVDEDPQLSMPEGLAHPGEGLPLPPGASGLAVWLVPTASRDWSSSVDVLDFTASLGIAWQVDLLVSDAAAQLASDLAPEAWRRHSVEGACASLVLEEWRREMCGDSGGLAVVPPEPRVAAPAGGGAAAGDGLGHEAIDDPAWLMLLVEDTLVHMSSDPSCLQPDLWNTRSFSREPGGDGEDFGATTTRGSRRFGESGSLLSRSTTFGSRRRATQLSEEPLVPRQEIASEIADGPVDEIALTFYCNLLEHVQVRRRLADAAHEVRALEVALARQADIVRIAGALVRADAVPELVALGAMFAKESGGEGGGEGMGVKRRVVLLSAGEVDSAFADVDLSSRGGVMAGCLPSRLQELRLMLQSEVANRWLCAACLLHNSLALDASVGRAGWVELAPTEKPGAADASGAFAERAARLDVDVQLERAARLLRGLTRASALSPLPAGLAGEVRKAGDWDAGGDDSREVASAVKGVAGAFQWPATLKSPIWLGITNSLRDRLKRVRVHMQSLTDAAERQRCLVQVRHRFLAYCSIFVAEKACDIAVRIQAARACGELRAVVAMIPPELSPFVVLKEDDSREMVRADGTVRSLVHLPRFLDVLALQGNSKFKHDIPKAVLRLEAQLPDFLEEARPEGGIQPTPSLEAIAYSGPAYCILRLMYELGQIVALSLFSASAGGDGHLLLRLHHFSALPDEADARKAAAAVLDARLLGSVQSDDEFEKEKTPQTAEQITWGSLESIQTDFMRLTSQVRSLRGSQGDFQKVLQLVRQRSKCDVLRAALLIRQAMTAIAQEENNADRMTELWRWLLHLEGCSAEGGNLVTVPGACAKEEATDEVGALARLTTVSPADGPWHFCQLGDDFDRVSLTEQAAAPEQPCPHLHPSALGVVSQCAGAAARLSLPVGPDRRLVPSRGRAPWVVPPLPLLRFTRALCTLEPAERQKVALLQSRLDMRAEEYVRQKGADVDHVDSLDHEQEMCQALLTLRRLKTAALCLQLRLPPPRSAAEQRRFEAAFIERFALRLGSNAEGEDAPAERSEAADNLRGEMIDAFETIGRLVASINTSVLKFSLAGLTSQLAELEAQAQSVGFQAVKAFSRHLAARGTRAEIFGDEGSSAWVIKEKDLDESAEEMGRRILTWACAAGERQLAAARERMARASEGLQSTEQQLQEARLELRHVRSERASRVAAAVGDQNSRQLFEVDRLRRALGQLAAASFEMEHRMDAEIRSGLLKELGALDATLQQAQTEPGQYRAEMLKAVLTEYKEMQHSVLNRVGDMVLPGLQARVRTLLEERGATVATEERLAKPAPEVVSASGHQERPSPIEALHDDIRRLQKTAARMQTYHQLCFQKLRQKFEEEVQRVAASLSSNAVHWERLTEVRERRKIVAEELARAERRGRAATAAVESLDSQIAGTTSDYDHLSRWWEKKSMAQAQLEQQLERYDARYTDVDKLNEQMILLNAEVERLSHGLGVEDRIAVQEETDAKERKRLRQQSRREAKLATKGVAKAHLLRTELELGHEDDGESLVAMLHAQWEEIMRDVGRLEQENQQLREGLPAQGGATSPFGIVASGGMPGPSTSGSSFEERLCYSVGALSARPRLQGASQIDQARATGALTDLLKAPRPGGGRSGSEPPRAEGEAKMRATNTQEASRRIHDVLGDRRAPASARELRLPPTRSDSKRGGVRLEQGEASSVTASLQASKLRQELRAQSGLMFAGRIVSDTSPSPRQPTSSGGGAAARQSQSARVSDESPRRGTLRTRLPPRP